ncbi:MAG: hypothetical protein A3H96_02985 [Acidobacteria bacterium RIFCSPLOWO2_02_FULL_67_36]|nr:MAG: hypothetical protein A3H96_02985 [Acidobacteria bacterium RIFCSPLOWO2_02_FULL_67_36]OFW18882.1 MAG: hypothetical protein A3G21_04005 [Acidobacteria bacterium RIFCSPLOWO2_12_FULL_66_21]
MTSYFAHESACIDDDCLIGTGTKIWHFSHVMPGARIGRECSLGQNVLVASGAVLGNNVKVQNNVSIYTGVILEDDVFCGPSTVFTNVLNPRSHVPRKHEYRQTLVRRGASLGANSTVLCGVTIGQYALIGAGAVVIKDVPDRALAVGNPSRIAGWVCDCGITLSHSRLPPRRAACATCGATYVRGTGKGLERVDVQPEGRGARSPTGGI